MATAGHTKTADAGTTRVHAIRMPARPPGRSKPAAHPEGALQREIVSYHSQACPQDQAVLLAVPNGEQRNKATAARMSGITAAQRALLRDDEALRPFGEGVLPGVSDLVLVIAGGRVIWVELKIPKITYPPEWLPLPPRVKRRVIHQAGTLSTEQRRFRDGVLLLGHSYRVIRTVEEYADLLEEFGCRVRSRPWGPGVRNPRLPLGFVQPGG